MSQNAKALNGNASPGFERTTTRPPDRRGRWAGFVLTLLRALAVAVV